MANANECSMRRAGGGVRVTQTQLPLAIFQAANPRDPVSCPHARATVDISGGKAKCGAYGDGETWTNCIELGRCTLFGTPPDT